LCKLLIPVSCHNPHPSSFRSGALFPPSSPINLPPLFPGSACQDLRRFSQHFTTLSFFPMSYACLALSLATTRPSVYIRHPLRRRLAEMNGRMPSPTLNRKLPPQLPDAEYIPAHMEVWDCFAAARFWQLSTSGVYTIRLDSQAHTPFYDQAACLLPLTRPPFQAAPSFDLTFHIVTRLRFPFLARADSVQIFMSF